MAAVGLDIATLTTLVKNFEDSITAIRGEISKIDDAAEAAKAGWKGQANQAFNSAVDNWHDTAQKLESDLDNLTQAVETGKNTLINMDQENA